MTTDPVILTVTIDPALDTRDREEIARRLSHQLDFLGIPVNRFPRVSSMDGILNIANFPPFSTIVGVLTADITQETILPVIKFLNCQAENQILDLLLEAGVGEASPKGNRQLQFTLWGEADLELILQQVQLFLDFNDLMEPGRMPLGDVAECDRIHFSQPIRQYALAW